jgi:trimeric autotransporter adhesin
MSLGVNANALAPSASIRVRSLTMRGVVLVLTMALGCGPAKDDNNLFPDSGGVLPPDGSGSDPDGGTDGPGPIDGPGVPTRLQQSAYFKASNTGPGDTFGDVVAMSSDGLTIAIGAPREQSSAKGIDGNQLDNSMSLAGAVYVFTYRSGSWVQEAYLKASNTGAGDLFGYSLAFSGDGSRLAVGATGEASAAKEVGGNELDNTAPGAGAVYVFHRAAGVWAQEAYIKATNSGRSDGFGSAVALSFDGSILAVGAENEASAAPGINGDALDNTAPWAGAAYVFERSGISWEQTTYVKSSNPDIDDFFGSTLSLSADGQTLAVGAEGESSAADGVNADQNDDSAESAGAAYVFRRISGAWSQDAYIKAAHSERGDLFGGSVSLSANGASLAIAARSEDGGSSGVDGNPDNKSAINSGSAYLFSLHAAGWRQSAYVKASNPSAGDTFGWDISLSADGTALAVGAVAEDSAATGIDGAQTSETARSSGATYLYRLEGDKWLQRSYVKASNTNVNDQFGTGVALSRTGATLLVGAYHEASKATGVNGDQNDNSAGSSGAAYLFETK